MSLIDSNKLQDLAIFIGDELALELSKSRQNHVATGNLMRTITHKIKEEGGKVVIEILMNDYYRFVNEGRKPNSKPPPVAVLAKWIEDKSLALNDVKGKDRASKIMSLAFAIQKTIAKQGSPTKGSFKHSKTGKRKNFIDLTFERVKLKIENMIEEAIGGDFDLEITKIINDVA